ncbi:hypothetical protein [Nostoc sp. NOS(2021)]|uniref:hypothetical protein n=1 Tax=Nostoc sp. NOS(2021) TaxID=2815407 RepID=UPI0034584BB6
MNHTEVISLGYAGAVKSLPQADLQTIEDKFIPALGESDSIVESAKYQVRKFPICR